METKDFSLTVDGKYKIDLGDDFEVTGIFKGYSSLGSEIALVIEMDGGQLRFVPVRQIRYMDQIELPKPEDEPKKVDIYYR